MYISLDFLPFGTTLFFLQCLLIYMFLVSWFVSKNKIMDIKLKIKMPNIAYFHYFSDGNLFFSGLSYSDSNNAARLKIELSSKFD